MTQTRTTSGSNEQATTDDRGVTYDLLICHADRVIFHGHYQSPALRLRVCASLLTSSDLLDGLLTTSHMQQIHQLHQNSSARWRTEPDDVVVDIADMTKSWGVQILTSTTKQPSAHTLYSVITQYGMGQTIAEHFPDRKSRRESLLERAGQFFQHPQNIPEVVLEDENKLAALLATFLMPADISLTQSSLDPKTGTYRPTGTPMSIH